LAGVNIVPALQVTAFRLRPGCFQKAYWVVQYWLAVLICVSSPLQGASCTNLVLRQGVSRFAPGKYWKRQLY